MANMQTQFYVVALLTVIGCAFAEYTSVQDAVAKLPELSMLNDNTNAIALADKLKDPTFVGTLFAPTNSALKPLQEAVGGDLTSLLGDPSQVNDVFSTAVIPGKALTLTDLKDGMKLDTLNGNTVDVHVVQTNGGPIYYVNKAAIVTGNIKAGKSVIHEMSNIVVPPEYQDMLDALVPADTTADKPTVPVSLASSASPVAAEIATPTPAATIKTASAGTDAAAASSTAVTQKADAADAAVARVLATESPPVQSVASPKPAGSSAGTTAVGAALLAVPALLAVLL